MLQAIFHAYHVDCFIYFFFFCLCCFPLTHKWIRQHAMHCQTDVVAVITVDVITIIDVVAVAQTTFVDMVLLNWDLSDRHQIHQQYVIVILTDPHSY